MAENDWKQMVKLAEHYKAIGQTRCWLSRADADSKLPWDYVVSVEPGSSHRLDIATSVSITAVHPCGLEFSWSMDIEESDANGRGHYKVDVGKLERVLEWLREKPREQFRAYLAECSIALIASAEKYEAIAGRERSTAARLALAATESVKA